MNHTRRVTFVVGGTRGDVQPYVVLAHALAQRGYPVQIAASARWQGAVNAKQVPLLALPPDPVELLLEPRFRHAMTSTPAGIVATMRYLRAMRPYVERLRHVIPDIQRNACTVIAGVASQWVAQPALCASTPFVWGLFQPLAPTGDFASPMVQHALPRHLNRLSHMIVNRLMWASWRLHGMPAHGGLSNVLHQPAFFAFSQQLVPAWSDLAHQHAIVGWIGADAHTDTLGASLQRFLDEPAPYLVATFGTPAANESADIYGAVIAAAYHLGLRLLIQMPTHLMPDSLPTGVHVVTHDVPHREVFARAVAVIHHGGAGTTHACVAAGVPMVVVPRGIDQYFWAARAHALSLTPHIVPRQHATSGRIARVIEEILTQTRYRHHAQVLQTAMTQEDAVNGVAQILDRVV